MVLDPLSAISLAGNIVTFVDYTTKLVGTGVEAYCSFDGTSVAYRELEAIALHLESLSGHLSRSDRKLVPSPFHVLSENENAFSKLAQSCEKAASELVTVLRELKFEGENRRWKSIVYAIKSLWSQSKIDEFVERINRYRTELSFHLLTVLHDNQANLLAYMDQIDDRIKTSAESLSKESQNIKLEIISAIQSSQLNPSDADDIRRMSLLLGNMAAEDRSAALQQKMLYSLAFGGMRDRHHQIITASEGTCEWAFNKNGPRHASRGALRYWLRHQNGIFWVSGKAGAGKSTFMKFLPQQQETCKALEAWGGTDSLIVASYYFWNSGRRLQKSQLGLLQSLMHDIIGQSPRLIPTILPARWRSYVLFGTDLDPWSVAELSEAFERLRSEATVATKFCLFIDGLDEYDGDHKDLVKVIKFLGANQNIKICTSSRPWTIFEDSFRECPKILLQDVNRVDIATYTWHELKQNTYFNMLNKSEPTRIKPIVEYIVNQSSGVFLWVFLVTRSLQEGLTNGDRVTDLESRVRSLPPDLEAFFLHMLKGLNTEYFEQAAQLFRLMLEVDAPLTLWTISYFDEEDPEFVMSTPIKPLTNDQVMVRCTRMKRCLKSRCMGLLETQELSCSSMEETSYIGRMERTYDQEVVFLHRTVRDFLNTPSHSIELVAPDSRTFNPHMVLLKGLIAKIRGFRPLQQSTVIHSWELADSAMFHASKLEQSGLKVNVELLDELDRAIHVYSMDATPLAKLFSSPYSIRYTDQSDLVERTTFLALAIRYGLNTYVTAKVGRLDRISISLYDPPLLLCCFMNLDFSLFATTPAINYKEGLSVLPNLEALRQLFSMGADPNAVFEGLTVWQRVLYALLLTQASAFSIRLSQLRVGWNEVIRLFVCNGAEPDTTISNDVDVQTADGSTLRKGDCAPKDIVRAFFPGTSATELVELIQEKINAKQPEASFQGSKELVDGNMKAKLAGDSPYLTATPGDLQPSSDKPQTMKGMPRRYRLLQFLKG